MRRKWVLVAPKSGGNVVNSGPGRDSLRPIGSIWITIGTGNPLERAYFLGRTRSFRNLAETLFLILLITHLVRSRLATTSSDRVKSCSKSGLRLVWPDSGNNYPAAETEKVPDSRISWRQNPLRCLGHTCRRRKGGCFKAGLPGGPWCFGAGGRTRTDTPCGKGV